MKAVNVDDVLKILHSYGSFIFVTYEQKYTDMEYKIANLPSVTRTDMSVIENIKAEIAKLRDSWETDCYHDEANALNTALKIINKHLEGAK